ncbi:MAG: hypothetical protein QXU97_01385 [Fervidicoccaceae archaeon]
MEILTSSRGLYAKDCLRLPREIEKWNEETLAALSECELMLATRLLIGDLAKGRGAAFAIALSESGELCAVKASLARVADENEPWERITELLGDCMDIRILRGRGKVWVICEDRELDLEEALSEVSGYEDPAVLCYHEWE